MILQEKQNGQLREELTLQQEKQIFVPTYQICPQLPVQETQVQSQLQCQEHILQHHPWTLLPTKPVHIEIKSNAKPFHGCAFLFQKPMKA
jgi:hypothetical protein